MECSLREAHVCKEAKRFSVVLRAFCHGMQVDYKRTPVRLIWLISLNDYE